MAEECRLFSPFLVQMVTLDPCLSEVIIAVLSIAWSNLNSAFFCGRIPAQLGVGEDHEKALGITP